MLLNYGMKVIFFSNTPAGFFALLTAGHAQYVNTRGDRLAVYCPAVHTTSLIPYFDTALISFCHTLRPRMS